MMGRGILLACAAAILGSTSAGLGAESDEQQPFYANDRVVVVFEPNIVTPPVDAAADAVEAYRFTSPQLSVLLAGVGARRMVRLFPNFSHESVHTTSVNGEPITLPHDLTDVYMVSLSDTNVIAAASALRADRTNIRIAEPDYIGWVDYSPNDSLFSQQWWLQNTGQFGGTIGEDIKAASAWNITTGTGTPIRVGIIDTGIDISGSGHPDLGLVEQGPNYVGSGPPDDIDPGSHGTAVAGIVGARGNNREGVVGVDWGVQLVSIKVSDLGGILQTTAAQALDWARNNGIRIVNMSFGWTVIPSTVPLSERVSILFRSTPFETRAETFLRRAGDSLRRSRVESASQGGCTSYLSSPQTADETLLRRSGSRRLAPSQRWDRGRSDAPRRAVASMGAASGL